MSETINGDFTIPAATHYAPVNIQASTSASPIAVTFTGAHGFNDLDSIQVEGHTVNTAANGDWVFHKTGANTGTLLGSTGIAAGTTSGYAIDYAINPVLTVPDDADLASASSVNPAFEGLFDAVPFMFQRVGFWKLYDQVQFNGGDFFTTTSTTTVNSSTWTNCGIPQLAGGRYVAPGDVLELSFTSSISASASSVVACTFGLSIAGGAASPQAGGQDFGPSTSGVIVPMVLSGNTTIPAIGTARPYAIIILGKSSSATPDITLSGPYSLTIRHWRAVT